MAGSRAPRYSAAAAPARFEGVRHALLGTLPGRVLVVGALTKLLRVALGRIAGPLPAFADVIDTLAGMMVVGALVYFCVRLFIAAKRRLLWRVRRKLILSYIFIGFVPAILIVAFFLLCGLLLFYNFSSYLVQARLRVITAQAQFLAESTAAEILRGGGRDVAGLLTRRQTNAAGQFQGISFAVVPVDRQCGTTAAPALDGSPAAPTTAGPWAHVDVPRGVPGWVTCSGWAGLLAYSHAAAAPAATERPVVVIEGQRLDIYGSEGDTHILVRAVAFPDSTRPGYAVVVDILVNDAVKEQLKRDTGVEFKKIVAVPASAPNTVTPLPGRGPAETADAAERAAGLNRGPLSWVSFLEYRDWDTGGSGTLFVSTQLSIAEIYARISAAQGRIGNGNFNQALLLVLLVVVGGLFLIIQVVALIVGLALAKSITGSVHELFTGTERVRQGDFTHKIAVKAQDQLGELASSFNEMTASIEDLLQQAAEKKRLEEELRIAREIQMSLLPQGALSIPGLSVTALCVPAREVGGDYYDLLPLADDRLGVLIADVSGKGTSAALYMAELKGLVLSLSQIHRSPRELLIAANRIIAKNLDARSFITMTYAVIDLRAQTMTYARAGHTPLIHLPGAPGESRRVRILAPDGLVLGLKIDEGEMFERLLEEQTIPLHPGDLYLFFTDGISEAMNAQDDCFGESRLAEIVQAHAHLSTEELRERVLREIEVFVADAPQHDDMTMILLKVEELVSVAPRLERADAAEVAN